MYFYQRIRDIREDNDISQKEMAQILGINRSRYSLWELGINIIPLNYLVLFADYFNISLEYVLNLNNNRNNKNLVKGLNLLTLGNNLKALRIKNNLSQNEMASILKVSQACINKYEKGNILISLSNLYMISKEFNVSLSKLCGKIK